MTALRAAVARMTALLDRWHWLAVGLIAPALLFPVPGRLLLWLIVPCVWAAGWITRREPLPATPFNSALLVLYSMVLVSLWATYDLSVSLGKLGGMVLGAGVFIAVTRESRTRRGWWLAFLVFAGIGAGIAAIALIGTRWTPKIAFLAPIIARLPPPLVSLPGAEDGFQPNGVAGALLWVLPVLLLLGGWLAWRRPALQFRWGMVPAWVLIAGTAGAAVLVLGVLVLTQSRGGWLAFGATLAASGLAVLAWRGHWRWAAGMFVALVFSVAAFLVAGGLSLVAELSGAGQEAVSLDTFEGRLELWSRAMYAIQDFPFTGMGMNTFRTVVHALYPLFLIAPDFDVAHAHNEFLQAALDLGLPGLVAFTALHLLAAALLWQVARRGRDELDQLLALGLGAGLLSHFFYGMTDAIALGAKVGVLFWLLLGLIAGLYSQVVNAARTAGTAAHG